jgi:DNA-3-methyladenine glycosylase II
MNVIISNYFRKHDPILYAVLQRIPDSKGLGPRRTKNYFLDLCEAIINQQLSDKAASTIFSRFIVLFPDGITPDNLLRISDKKIRSVGTSWNKVKFLKSLASAVVEQRIHLDQLDRLSDSEVSLELTKIKGIGPWTAEMFLMFSLGRPDIFSFGDVGLRRAIQKLYSLKREPTVSQMKKLTKKWSPYRTYACRILWRSLDLSQ